mmetsp:Transcript_42398/g.51413  ORF Transcript_42398/g.51413 Transcript_42398/m.51413 type:complete len:172 (-) Transcript_42398:1026-1541(-)
MAGPTYTRSNTVCTYTTIVDKAQRVPEEECDSVLTAYEHKPLESRKRRTVRASPLNLAPHANDNDDSMLFDGLNVALYDGDHIALVGPNGCGKSTLVKLLTGRLQPSCGTVESPHPMRIMFFEQGGTGRSKFTCCCTVALSLFWRSRHNTKQPRRIYAHSPEAGCCSTLYL